MKKINISNLTQKYKNMSELPLKTEISIPEKEKEEEKEEEKEGNNLLKYIMENFPEQINWHRNKEK